MLDSDLEEIIARNPGVDRNILEKNINIIKDMGEVRSIRPSPKVERPYANRRVTAVDAKVPDTVVKQRRAGR